MQNLRHTEECTDDLNSQNLCHKRVAIYI